MADAYEEELDRLFRLPPGEMVAARDALAGQLRKAKEPALAARVKALKRPTPSAWALNQVHFDAPPLITQAAERTREVRALHAQDGVEPDLLRRAHEAQRTATAALLEAVMARCAEAGLPHGPAQQKKALITVRALLAGLGAEPPGRLTQDLEPAGFDAMGELGAPAPRKAPAPLEPSADETEARERERLRGELEEAEEVLARATAEAEAQRAREAECERGVLALSQAVRELEAQLEAQKREVRREREALIGARAQREQAEAREQTALRRRVALRRSLERGCVQRRRSSLRCTSHGAGVSSAKSTSSPRRSVPLDKTLARMPPWPRMAL